MENIQRVAIIGSGFSGLVLALLFEKKIQNSTRITVIDPHFDKISRKTLCFWGNIPPVLQPFIQRTWSKVSVGAEGCTRSDCLASNLYHRIDEQKLINYGLYILKNHPQFSMQRSLVKDFRESNNQVQVVTSQGIENFDWVFSSMPEPNPSARLFQHFGGWEVEMNLPVFESDQITLMDFNTPQNNKTSFFYVLPNSPKSALVEYTVISSATANKSVYEDAIRSYIHGLGCDSYSVNRREFGIIPMDPLYKLPPVHPRVIRIGRAGGLTKPSTGYTVRRSIHHLVRLVDTFYKYGYPITRTQFSSPRHGWYDKLLLNLLVTQPDCGEKLLGRLLLKNRIDDVFDFLDEKTHILQELKLFWALPWWPFINELFFGSHSRTKKHNETSVL